MITPTVYKDKEWLKVLLNNITEKTIILISKSAAERWEFNIDKNKNILWLYNVEPNPTPKTLYKALTKIKNNDFSINNIIAIGGGSVIDLAKGIIAIYPLISTDFSVDTVRNSIKDKSYLDFNPVMKTDFMAVPTTAGTGSECTQWATIWDDLSNAKFSIDSPLLYPNNVVLIPELTLGLSARLTASTGLDAAAHAIEAYWAKSGDALSKALSVRALEILVPNLYKLHTKILNDNINWRKQICTGAYISGLSFSRTRTTACHSISYPLTSMFGIEHGFAVAMTLDEVAKINGEAIDLTEIFDIFKPVGGIKGWLDGVTENIVELSLSGFGVRKRDIQGIVDNAFTGGRMDNNPVEIIKYCIEYILNHYQLEDDGFG